MLANLRRSRDERGVIAVAVALITCFMLIPIAAYAVDLGVQRVARTDAQSIADVVALDMSRQLDGRTLAQLQSASPSLQSIANKSAASSSSAGHGVEVTLEFGKLDPGAYNPANPSAAGYFTVTTTGTDVPDAVRVTVAAKVGFTFIGGTGGVTRSAIGNAAHRACVMMDSYAAAIRTSESELLNGEWAIHGSVNDSTASVVLAPLNQILGANINTTVLGSSGILTTDMELLSFLNALKTTLNVGSIDEVLSSQATAAQIVAAEIAALNADGASAAASALQSEIAARISSSTLIQIDDLLGLTQGGASAIGATANPFDLAAAAVQVANGTSAVSASVTPTSGANLTGLTASATIGSRPTPVCLGEGRKEMNQTTIQADANVNQSGTLTGSLLNLTNGLTSGLGALLCVLPLPGSTCYSNLQISNMHLTANAGLAQAAATVTDVTCTGKNKADITVLEQSQLAPATAALTFTISMTKTVRPLFGASVVTTLSSTVTTSITTATPADQSTTEVYEAPADEGVVKQGPYGDLSVTGLTVAGNTNTSVTGDLATVLGGATSVINNVNGFLLSPLLNTAVEPLLTAMTESLKDMVGLTVAGSSYTLQNDWTCQKPRLAG